MFPASPPTPPREPSEDNAHEDFDQLFSQWRTSGDPQLREELIYMHTNLVHYIVRRFADRGETLEDLQQQGMIGLIRALDHYDPERGVRFATFATPTIIGEIRHYFRDKSHSVRVPRQVQEIGRNIAARIESLSHELGRSPSYREIATAMSMSVEDVIQCVEALRSRDAVSLDEPRSADDSSVLVDQLPEETSFLQIDDLMALQMALERLPKRERRALQYIYFEGLTQAETAHAMHVSQMHISRLLRKGLALLRRYLDEHPHSEKPAQ